jgi:hypothetical protein
LRTAEALIATQRPSFTLVERDSASGREDSTRLVAERVAMNGNDVHASGDVVITRSDLEATADSLYANRDPAKRSLHLMRRPVLVGRGSNTFRLSGRVIHVEADSSRQLRRVVALDSAKVEATQLDLAGDTVELSFNDKVITAAHARGDSGAFMRSQQNTMTGRTLDVAMADGRLEQLKAIGKGRAELAPDSAQSDSAMKNFVEGDTVVIGFEPIVRARRPAIVRDSAGRVVDTVSMAAALTAPPDTTVAPRSILAAGNARVLYQRAGQRAGQRADSGCVIFDYWIGRRISATLQSGQMRGMKVVGGAVGLNSDCAPARGAPGAPGRIPPP